MQPPLAGQGSEFSYQRVRTSGSATGSLVFGILGLFCLPILASVPAIFLGHLARARIRRSGGTLDGDGLAVAGLLMGYISLLWVLVLLPIGLAISLPRWTQTRNNSNARNACIQNLREIDTAVKIWMVENHRPPNARVTFDEIRELLPVIPECPTGGTYTLHAVGENPTCSIRSHQLPPEQFK